MVESISDAPVAQLDRASAFEAEGREFESLRARHSNPHNVFAVTQQPVLLLAFVF